MTDSISAPAQPVDVRGPLERLGQFFFRFRNTLFPVLFMSFILLCPPGTLQSAPHRERILPWVGLAIALSGQAYRLLVIGLAYIQRGGASKQVYATTLQTKGLYSHSRNPMYFGNILIAIGCALVYDSVFLMMVVIPFFILAYVAIVAEEERYLRNRFGEEYELFARQVARFVPRVRGLWATISGMSYDWRTAVIKEYGTLSATLAGLLGMLAYKRALVVPEDLAFDRLWFQILLTGALSTALSYVLARTHKKDLRAKRNAQRFASELAFVAKETSAG